MRCCTHFKKRRNRLQPGFQEGRHKRRLEHGNHDSIELELRELISSEQAEALASGSLDSGIARNKTLDPRLVVAARMSDPFCIALPARKARKTIGPAELRDFESHDFVAFTRHRGPAYFDQSIHLCAKAGFSPRIRYEASTVRGVLDLVASGLGVALVPSSSVLLGATGIDFCRFKSHGASEALVLLRRKTDANPLLVALADQVRAILVAASGDIRARLG